MTLLPVMSVGVLVLAVVVALALVWWPQPGPQPSLRTRVRRTLLVAAVLVASLRPGLPGAEVRASSSELNVFFVVDTTTSSMAEDFGTDPRMSGMPRPRNRKSCPDWVPAGILTSASPWSEGTRIVVPRAAWGKLTGTSQTKSLPSRTKKSSDSTSMKI